MYNVEQSASFECIAETGLTGLVGTISLQIVDNIGNVVVAPSTAGIIEFPAGSGVYQAVRTAPADLGQYGIIWSPDGSFSSLSVIADDLTVGAVGTSNVLPPIPPGPDPGPSFGPCNQWTLNEDIAACCSLAVGSDVSVFEEANNAASRALFELSARLYPGVCTKTVRPCRTSSACSFQVLSRGHIVGWDGSYWNGIPCGCQHLSQVELSGYPVRQIIEVKIDGVVVDPSYYRLDRDRYLTAMNGTRWPTCQRLDLEDTEDGTWSVSYTYGQNPPDLGQAAARELACELYKSCAGNADLECTLPNGVTRIQRQGIVIERSAFIAWGRTDGIWKTGLPLVDAFLNTYNPSGIRRRPVIMTPGKHKYPLSA